MTKATQEKFEKSAKKVAQVRRLKTLKQRREYVMNLPESDPLLCLNELSAKTRLPFQLLRKIIIEENKIPFMKISNRYYVNYTHWLKYLQELD